MTRGCRSCGEKSSTEICLSCQLGTPGAQEGLRAPDPVGIYYAPDRFRVERGDYVRVGDFPCLTCGELYHDHAPVQGYPWLRRACDGRLLKL